MAYCCFKWLTIDEYFRTARNEVIIALFSNDEEFFDSDEVKVIT